MRGSSIVSTVLGASLGALMAVSLGASSAGASTFGFDCLTGNRSGDCGIGESQLSVEVSDLGGGDVLFHFRNAGPEPSAISEIYFDDGSLLDLSTLTNGDGVDFRRDATPPNLPGGEDAVPPFVVTEGFLAESSEPPPLNGVGPGEWVKIEFALQAGRTFDDVLAELGAGTLRIGVHVIGFASGGSESFINEPAPVPAPGAALLLGGAAAGVAARQLRRGRSGASDG